MLVGEKEASLLFLRQTVFCSEDVRYFLMAFKLVS